ncbi:CaiB/BaiF CoA-transferase family protein [Microbacterium sp. USTB-Y]|uniref:CaiB/BaiF CoA transferase family protein n=1 Tax=Microbacterium sp. USTB-Y TaxID=2823692 RepID=UPI00203E50B2|nr:CoA transferase [Microbacterium sp. USTB-Y]
MSEQRNEPRGPLDGVRVADFSRVLAGPYATMTLADFGADVIKVEPQAGDDTRHWRPPVDAEGTATYFGSVNRNKRSVALDLATEAGRTEAIRLAASADVVVENFRPGVMARFGLDHAAVRARNPAVVYCSITGFGAGAGAELAGYDLLVQAVGGLMSITGDPDGPATKAGVALVDVLCGQNAVNGILLALRERDRTGEGQRVEVNLLHSLLSALTNQAASTLATGRPPQRLGNAHPSIAPYALFRAADRDLVIAVGNDRQFAALATTLGRPGLAEDPRFATNTDRVAHREPLTAEIEAALAAAPAGTWIERFRTARIPAGLVNDVAEAIAFAEALGLDTVVGLGPSRTIASPIGLSTTPARYRTAPPALDAAAGADWHPRKDPS